MGLIISISGIFGVAGTINNGGEGLQYVHIAMGMSRN